MSGAILSSGWVELLLGVPSSLVLVGPDAEDCSYVVLPGQCMAVHEEGCSAGGEEKRIINETT